MSNDLPDSQVLCAGVVVADHLCTPISHLPAAGELVKADELILNIGGCASNAAVVLAKLGIRAAVCGRVGDDAFGRYIAETFDSYGVDTRGLRVDPRKATSQSLIVNVKGQDRRFIHSFGANENLSVEDLEPGLAMKPRVVYVGGFLILPSLDPLDLADRFAKARAGGALTVLDVATPGPGDYLPRLEPVLPHVDVFLPNTDEAALILGDPDPIRQALAFREMGARRVVITRGGEGAIVASDTLRARLGAYSVPYVDGTGGGDAFDGGYIAGLVEGLSEIECLQLASAVGASCVRAVGTTAGIFNREEARAFIRERGLTVEAF
ncbi:carbohydrate kinase family protein [Tundrisphaera lichenicola]|uniref:carbohydrate kinase family protein n=1 Tax=Tundrisphaera lichenicola TaxID=2029860 RepID=UPI003EBD74A3